MRIVGALFAIGAHGLLVGLALVVMIFWWFSRDLPSATQLAEHQPATLSRVHSGDGAVLAEFVRERRLHTPYDEIPPLVVHAFVSAEDKNFFLHGGVDGLGLAKAMVDNVQRVMGGRRLRGASTITQQVVKNFLLDGQKAVSRKIREALLAYRLEGVLTKEQILELYLNEVFLGSRAYGVTSAALRYFGKRLEELTPAEAAYLAALPKAPSTYHPVTQKARATERRDYVLKEMFENGYLSEEEYADALATELTTLLDTPESEAGVAAARPDLGYFSEEVRREMIDRFGEEVVYGGGLSIRATVDPRLQDVARRALQQRLWDYSRARGYSGPIARLAIGAEGLDPSDADAWREAMRALEIPRDVAPWRPALVLEVGDASVRIGVEGVDDAEPILLGFDDVAEWAAPRIGVDEAGDAILGDAPGGPSDVWAVGDVIYVAPIEDEAGAVTGWSMRQIPELNGAVVMMDPHTGRVLAIQGGFSFDESEFNRATQAARQPGSAFKPFVYAAALEHLERTGERAYLPNSIVLDAPLTIEQVDGTLWRPRNYSGNFYGPVPFRWGLEKSHNLMTVRIAMDVGLETVAGYAERFGVYEDMPPLFSFALGAGETTLLKLTASYAMFVNGGKRIEPTLVDRIQDRFGVTVYRHDDRICLGCSAPEWNGGQEPYVPDEGEQVMDPITAFQVVMMMEGVTVRGTAASVGKALPFTTAGKTGTTNDGRDAWFVGFTPDLVVGCFIGYDQPRPLGRRMSGGRLCAPVFIEAMKGAAEVGGVGADGGDFRQPSGVLMVRLDRESGCVVPDGMAGAQYIWEAFRAEEAPYVGECPEGGIGGGGLGGGGLGGGLSTGVAVGAESAEPVGAEARARSGEGSAATAGVETGASGEIDARAPRETPGEGEVGRRPPEVVVIQDGSGGLY